MVMQWLSLIFSLFVGALLFALCLLCMQLSRLALHLVPLPSFGAGVRENQLFIIETEGEQKKELGEPQSEVERLHHLINDLEQTKAELVEQKQRLEEALLLVEMDNYRKTEELLEAQQLQLSMLPRHTPFYPGYEIALYSEPATEVGGDYYDYCFGSDYKSLFMVLGDATGHGYKPSILVATAKSYFQTLAGKIENEQLLRQISEAIYSLNARGLYMALSLLKIDGDLVTIVSSGMPPVYYYQAKTNEVRECRFKGMFLGVGPKVQVNKKVFRMHRGDALLLMTDGLAEAQNEEGELLGFEALKRMVGQYAMYNSKAFITQLLKEGERWKGNGSWKDDKSLVAIRKK